MSSQAARRIDEDIGAEGTESSPEDLLRRVFWESACSYYDLRRGVFEASPKTASFFNHLSDMESHEHKKQFFIFVLTMALRTFFPRSKESCALTEEELKFKSDLSILFTYVRWDEALMLREVDSGNEVAKLICNIMRIDGRVYGCRRPKGWVVTDTLSELRLRLRRGGLWRDELWWPRPPEPEEE